MRTFIACFLVVIMLCTVVSCAPMTEEEVAQRQQKLIEFREANTYRYEVISAYRFVEATTSNFGAVLRTDIKYGFVFVDDNGNSHERKIQHFENGLTKVKMGDKDEYVVQGWSDGLRILYLTKDTYEKIGIV